MLKLSHHFVSMYDAARKSSKDDSTRVRIVSQADDFEVALQLGSSWGREVSPQKFGMFVTYLSP